MAPAADAASRAHLDLPGGGTVDFEIRSSGQARSLRLNISARNGLVVTAPPGLARARVMQLVAGKAEWIAGRLADFESVQHLVTTQQPARPQAFDLRALAESWRVEYKQTRSKNVAAQTDQPGRIVVSGAIDDTERCQAALRRWVARRAAATLPDWLSNLGRRTGIGYFDLAIKNQRTRWGSCAPQGRISLNCKLLFLPRDLVRYVMAHELCHRLEPNHSERFWVHLRRVEPRADALHGQMRDAWKQVPAWAQRGSGAVL